MESGDRAQPGPSVISVAGAALGKRIAAALDEDGVRVAGTVRDAHEAASQPVEKAPDAFVLVGELLGKASDEADLLRRRFPQARTVVVAAVATPVDVRGALSRGIDGVVLEDDLERALAATVRAVCRDQIVLPGRLRPSVLKSALSTREKQALAMVVLGFTNREISRKLYVTESTVKSHLSSAFTKLGVRTRAQATQLILDPEHGLGTGVLAISDDIEPIE